MAWFKRHLNWTWVLGMAAYYFVCSVYGFVLGLLGHPDLTDIDYVVIYGLFVAMPVPLTFWVLWQKGRSLWWILLSGWLAPLWLSNKKKMTAQANAAMDSSIGAQVLLP